MKSDKLPQVMSPLRSLSARVGAGDYKFENDKKNNSLVVVRMKLSLPDPSSLLTTTIQISNQTVSGLVALWVMEVPRSDKVEECM